MRAVNMSLGWDKAVGAVHFRNTDMMNNGDFPSPNWAAIGGMDVGQASGSVLKAVSRPRDRAQATEALDQRGKFIIA